MFWLILILSGAIVGAFVWAYFWLMDVIENSDSENNKSKIQD